MNSAPVAVADVAVASHYNNLRKDLILMAGDYALTTGSANAFVLDLDAQITALTVGMVIKFKASFTPTGISTINVNGLGAVYFSKAPDYTQLLSPGDITSGSFHIAQYDGTYFRLYTAPNTPAGTIVPFVGATAPTGWVVADGTSYSKTLYQTLHKLCNYLYGDGAINTKITATFTVTAGTDRVNKTSHGLNNDIPLVLTSSGTLPAGLALATTYWVINATTNDFQVSLTRGGAAVDITGAGSGTHTYTQWMTADNTNDTLYSQAHGLSDGDIISFSSTGSLPTGLTASTDYYVINKTADTFKVSTSFGGSAVNITADGTVGANSFRANFLAPDLTGRVPVGKNAGTFVTQGSSGGEETHVLTTAELAAHTHALSMGTTTGAGGLVLRGQSSTTDQATQSNGSGSAHNNLQPYLTIKYIIKT